MNRANLTNGPKRAQVEKGGGIFDLNRIASVTGRSAEAAVEVHSDSEIYDTTGDY